MKKMVIYFFFFFVKNVYGDIKTHYMYKNHQLFTFRGEKPPLLTNDFSNIEREKFSLIILQIILVVRISATTPKTHPTLK